MPNTDGFKWKINSINAFDLRFQCSGIVRSAHLAECNPSNIPPAGWASGEIGFPALAKWNAKRHAQHQCPGAKAIFSPCESYKLTFSKIQFANWSSFSRNKILCWYKMNIIFTQTKKKKYWVKLAIEKLHINCIQKMRKKNVSSKSNRQAHDKPKKKTMQIKYLVTNVAVMWWMVELYWTCDLWFSNFFLLFFQVFIKFFFRFESNWLSRCDERGGATVKWTLWIELHQIDLLTRWIFLFPRLDRVG